MQLMVSRSYPVIDAQTLAEYVTRDALFRAADGSYFLYMTSMDRVEGEERVLFLDCRDALLWLNENSRRAWVILAFRRMREAALSSANHRLGRLFSIYGLSVLLEIELRNGLWRPKERAR